MLELQNISKSYGSVTVLQPLDLSIERGSTLVMIGPSGCGKSTLLRIMIGLVPSDEGRVCFDGETITPVNVLKLRLRMGYVLQDGGLFPHMTVRDNVTLMARRLRKMTDAALEERVHELASLTRLPHAALDRRPTQISGGQRQRVAIMRALMLDPPLLLLDEPMGALDPVVRYELQNDLKEIFAELNKTVVLVTHDLGEAAFFGGEVLLLSDGRVVQRGAMVDFVERPTEPLVTQFLQAYRPLDLSASRSKPCV